MQNALPFRCVQCQGNLHIQSTDEWVCERCAKKFPVVRGIPILVQDYPQLATRLSDLSSIKPGWYLEEQPPETISPWRHHVRKRRLYVEAVIQKYLASQNITQVEALLDLGCGDGNHLDYLQHYAKNSFGCDYNLVRLARAIDHYPSITFFLADLLNYPVNDNSFDIIFFSHVLEHIKDDEKALQNAFHVLKPGGLMVLGTPNEGEWWWQLAYKLQPEILKSTDHVHFYTAETIQEKMRWVGFEVMEVKYMGWGPPHWGLDSRIRKYKAVDDGFETIGKILFPKQASSLFVIARKTV